MPIVDLVMPKMGESVMEGTVLGWLKQVGDSIEMDEAVLEVATDKVDTEVPAPYEGTLKEQLVKEGDVVPVGAPIARMETTAAGVPAAGEPAAGVPAAGVPADIPASADSGMQAPPQPTPAPVPAANAEAAVAAVTASVANAQALSSHAPAGDANNGFYSPLVLNIAKEEGISVTELQQISGSGKDQRLTKKDLFAHIEQRKAKPQQVAAPQAVQQPQASNGSLNGHSATVTAGAGEELIEMDRMRKMIADRMVQSVQTSPHVTSFVEADVTGLFQWRQKQKRAFAERYGGALTFTPIFIEAVAKALRDMPNMNVSVEGSTIIKKKYINVGMAVALPSGNLIVPVIKDADMLNLSGLAVKVNDLAQRARENKLKPDDLSGGTYTVSNVGTFGNVMGTPIIMQPQVGILALGAIRKLPAVIETPQGDFIGIRNKMFLSHSYDHRVVDGALGGMFVKKVADYLEGFDTSRTL